MTGSEVLTILTDTVTTPLNSSSNNPLIGELKKFHWWEFLINPSHLLSLFPFLFSQALFRTGIPFYQSTQCLSIYFEGDFLEKQHTATSFSQKSEIILKISSTFPSTGSIGNHSIPLTVFPLKSANKDTENLNLLEKVPKGLRAKTTTDTRQIHSASPVKIQVDPSKPCPNIRPYPLNLEAIAGIEPIIEECKAQNLTVSCISPRSTLILSAKKLHGQGQRFVQDHKDINNTFTS